MRTLVILLWFVTWCRCEDEAIAQLVSRLVPQWGPCRFTALAALHPAATHAALAALHAAEPLCPVTVTSRLTGPSQDSLWPERVTRLLVLVHHVEELHDFLDLASEDDNWNPRAKVVLIMYPPQTMYKVHEALSITWSHKYQLLNTVACTLDSNSSGATVRLFTLMPQPPPACKQPALVELSTYEAGYVRFFSRKLADLMGCPFIIANMYSAPYFSYSSVNNEIDGVNANVLKILSEKLNFAIIVKPQILNNELIDTLFTQTLVDLFNNKIDVMPYPFDLELGEITFPFGWSGLSFAVAESDFIPAWMNLIIPFKMEVWVATLLTLIIQSLLQFIFLPNSFWPAYTSNLNIASELKPIYKVSSQIFLFNLLASGIVINTAYLSALYQSLTLPRRYPDIHTIDQLLETDLPVTGFKMIKYYIGLANESKFHNLHSRYIISNNDQFESVRNIIKYKNSSYTFDTLLLRYVQKILYSKENLRVHVGEEYIKFLNCFVLTKGSPYLFEFNSIITNIMQSGLYFKWEKELMLQKQSYLIINEKLTLKHFQSALYMLLVGYLLSFCVFLFELVFRHLAFFVNSSMLALKKN